MEQNLTNRSCETGANAAPAPQLKRYALRTNTRNIFGSTPKE